MDIQFVWLEKCNGTGAWGQGGAGEERSLGSQSSWGWQGGRQVSISETIRCLVSRTRQECPWTVWLAGAIGSVLLQAGHSPSTMIWLPVAEPQ